MSSTKKTSTNWLGILVAFALGTVFGLVVLGWWLWPVQWTGGSIDTITPQAQEDYLRAAIDSYTLNLNQPLAVQRYASLGESRAMLLAEIYNYPGEQDPLDIEAFATAVGAEDVLSMEVVPTLTTPQGATNFLTGMLADKPLWTALLPICGLILLLLFLILLIFLLIRRLRKSARARKEPQVLEPETETGEVEGTLQESEIQYFSPVSQEIPPSEAETVQLKKETEQAESEVPDWLKAAQEIEPEQPAEAAPQEQDFELSEADIQEIYTSPFSSADAVQAEYTTQQNAEIAALASVPFLTDEAEDLVDAAKDGQEKPEDTFAKFGQDILKIPGIDPEIAKDLKATGITAPLILLKRGASPDGRQAIASRLGVTEDEILALVNYIDLLRINGLALADLEPLKLAGIESISDLAAMNPMSLRDELIQISSGLEPGYSAPGIAKLESWKNQAQNMPPAIT